MKLYRITLKSRRGEPLILSVTADSLNEAMNKIDLAPGRRIAEAVACP